MQTDNSCELSNNNFEWINNKESQKNMNNFDNSNCVVLPGQGTSQERTNDYL